MPPSRIGTRIVSASTIPYTRVVASPASPPQRYKAPGSCLWATAPFTKHGYIPGRLAHHMPGCASPCAHRAAALPPSWWEYGAFGARRAGLDTVPPQWDDAAQGG